MDAAVLAEDLGFHSITLAHHLTVPTSWVYGPMPERGIIDPLVLMPAMAAATSRIGIGTNSAILPLLPPYAWAKYFASLDVLSKGRVVAGAAMGWFEEDFSAVGVNKRDRGAMFDEQLEVITRLWTEERVTHEGRFYQLKDAMLQPKPIQQPHPPIWIGGFLPSAARAAKYGRYLVPGNLTPEAIEQDFVPCLRQEADRFGSGTELCLNVNVDIVEDPAGPSPEALERLRRAVDFFIEPDIEPEKVAIIGPPEHCANRICEYRAAGVVHFLLDFQYHGAVSIRTAMDQMTLFVDKVVPLLG